MGVRVRRTVLKLLTEYVIVTSPILIYASLEALHHADLMYLFKSPEWSIATIFLTIQTIRIHLEEMHGNTGRLITYLLVMVLTGITLSAGINIYMGLGDDHLPTVATNLTKWLLLGLASILFVYIAGAAIYSSET